MTSFPFTEQQVRQLLLDGHFLLSKTAKDRIDSARISHVESRIRSLAAWGEYTVTVGSSGPTVWLRGRVGSSRYRLIVGQCFYPRHQLIVVVLDRVGFWVSRSASIGTIGADKHVDTPSVHSVATEVEMSLGDGSELEKSKTKMGEHMLDFYQFVSERQMIEQRKQTGAPRPWTSDPVLHHARFTNIDRNHDRGTIKLFEKVRHLPHSDLVLYVVLFRCAFSNLTLLESFSLNTAQDLATLRAGSVYLPGRKPYQVFLKKSQTMSSFLVSTAAPVAAFIARAIPTLSAEPIGAFADKVAEKFESLHGKRLIFLATEVVKDLSVLLPGAFDPDSECNMNVGAKRGLRYLGRGNQQEKVESIRKRTGLNFSTVEHAACEFARYRRYWKELNVNGTLKKEWIYTPSAEPLMTFGSALELAA